MSTTPAPLMPPDARSTAAGICARAEGSTALVQINVDTPSPRCEMVKPGQRLRVANKTGLPVLVRLAHFAVRLGPRQELTINQPFGTYLASGVHALAISEYAGGGAELWLRECYTQSARMIRLLEGRSPYISERSRPISAPRPRRGRI